MKARKISDGVYTYKNYRIEYKGWDKSTQSYWWEATNIYTNCIEFREHTLTEIIDDIDDCQYDGGEEEYESYD